MKQFIRLTTVASLLLLMGLNTSKAQEVTFQAGPAVTPATGAANGGFAWGDINGDGFLDVWIPSNNVLLSSAGTTFAPVASMTVNITLQTNSIGGLLADFNGDGVLDLFSTNNGTPASGLFYNVAGVFTAASGIGDLATAGVTGEVFQGASAAPIDHSNYLSLAWPGTFTNVSLSTGPYPGGGGIWLLKGGAAGFTDIGKGATGGNYGIDTSLSFESWDVRFFDANNDGWQDLLMPSFRNGFARIDTGSSGPRKGCVMFLNDGTGKFIVPTSATLLRPIYSVGLGGVVSTTADTGIVVDDTVRHFSAIGEQWGDLNNDGIEDLVLNGLGATDNLDGNGNFVSDIILYGKGDGTFTYKWNGVSVVASNGLVQATNQRAIDVGDYNNDGLLDIYTSTTNGGGAEHLYRNNGNGTFTDVAATDALSQTAGQRAGQFVDYNNDGFLDVYTYTGGTSTLQKNNGNANHWIGFIPIGAGHNMSAIAAKFTVYNGGNKQIRVIRADGGSAGDGGGLRANFGLGAATTVDSMRVDWPDGTVQSWTGTQLAAGGDVAVTNKYWTIKEGAAIPPGPVTSRPSWVSKGDTSLAATDTLRWNRVTGGTGSISYRVQIGTNRTFGTLAKDVSSLTDSNYVARLGLSTTYYWRVRAFSAGFTGVWSAIDSFKTLYTPCTTVPLALSPAPGTITVPKVPILKVSYVSTASTYHIQIDSVNRFTTNLVINDSTSILDTVYTSVKTLNSGQKYYWRVRGWNAAGSSSFSAVDSFTIMFTPAVPTLAYPGHNAANVPVPITFKWNHVSGDTNSVVQIWTYTATGLSMSVDTTLHDTSIVKSGLLNRQKYYWKVLAFNQGGSSAFSGIDSFTTVIEVPLAPFTLGPKSPTPSKRKATFSWTSSLNATSYHLQVASVNFPTATYVENIFTVTGDTLLTIPDTLQSNTTYYWHISAVNLGGEGAFSSTAFFTTNTTVKVDEAPSDVPKEFALLQNYPNPFNPSTIIGYDVPKAAFVTLKVYDILGRTIATLVDGVQSPQSYRVQWNASSMSSGVYFYRISAHSLDGSGDFVAVKKLMFMK